MFQSALSASVCERGGGAKDCCLMSMGYIIKVKYKCLILNGKPFSYPT